MEIVLKVSNINQGNSSCSPIVYSTSFYRTSIIELGDVNIHNIKLLRRLNQVIFPVSYNEKFYKDVLESGPLAKLGESVQKLIPSIEQFHCSLLQRHNGWSCMLPR